MREQFTKKVRKIQEIGNATAAGLLPFVTASLSDAKTLGHSNVMPNKLAWGSISIAETIKALSALVLAIDNYENSRQLCKDFMFTVVAPAAWATACALAVREEKFFGKPADALVFTPAFFYDSLIKIYSAYEKRKEGKAYTNDVAAAAAMFMLAVGVSGILLNVNSIVSLTFAGALLSLFKDVFFEKSTTISSNPLILRTLSTTSKEFSETAEPPEAGRYAECGGI